ncbi:10075_t:CDS:2 [Gigaspora margarita]|uniref:10075_t:CDS:1 n=1 Tax=Gigaspora margarita TaxID=4874 RepID=A0ABN7W5U7_GIGMA|nr:10075_t:CDS:2 [Gigaspora margarita]
MSKEVSKKKILSPSAKRWIQIKNDQMNCNLKVCNEKEIVLIIKEFIDNINQEESPYKITDFKAEEFVANESGGFIAKNVSIGKMVFKKNSNRHFPY